MSFMAERGRPTSETVEAATSPPRVHCVGAGRDRWRLGYIMSLRLRLGRDGTGSKRADGTAGNRKEGSKITARGDTSLAARPAQGTVLACVPGILIGDPERHVAGRGPTPAQKGGFPAVLFQANGGRSAPAFGGLLPPPSRHNSQVH